MNLPDDALERLLIDRELGELSDEAAMLIDAHLRSHPSLEVAARGTSETIRLARSAMAGAPMEPRLLLPKIDFTCATRRARRVSLGLRGIAGFAVAAALGLAAWIGFMFGGGRFDRARDAVVANSLRQPGLVAARSVPSSFESGFWSAGEVRRRASSSYKSPRTAIRHINWTSPVARPMTGASS